jgi:hypothetical protein
MKEIYEIIPDTEEMYEVSNYGNVRNALTNYVLRPYQTERGYFQVCLPFSSRNKRITINVHRLVANAFLKRREGKDYINHINGDKRDNRSVNLEWVTPAENNEHAVKLGLIASGEDAYLSVLTESEVLEIIDCLREGERNVTLAKKFKVAPNTIDDIRCNRTWRYLERDPIPGKGPIKRLTEEDVRFIKENLDKYPNPHFANLFNVANATINQIRLGNTWRHV